MLLRATPRYDLSYQTIYLLSTQAEEDLLSQNLPGVATGHEEFSLRFSQFNIAIYEIIQKLVGTFQMCKTANVNRNILIQFLISYIINKNG